MENVIMGFPYQKRHCKAFNIIGFSKIVKSGGELYEEIRADGRWEALTDMNPANKSIYCIASFDSECAKDHYRYSAGVVQDENYTENQLYADQLFRYHVKESDWIIFSIDFAVDYGVFWSKNPYKMISELGCKFNNRLGLHIDVFGAEYDGHMMDFWMPVK